MKFTKLIIIVNFAGNNNPVAENALTWIVALEVIPKFKPQPRMSVFSHDAEENWLHISGYSADFLTKSGEF